MFGIGFTELLLVLVVALLVLGPDKLPEVARTLAKAYNELRRTGLDLKRTVDGMNLTATLGKSGSRCEAASADEAGQEKTASSTNPDSTSPEGGKPRDKATET